MMPIRVTLQRSPLTKAFTVVSINSCTNSSLFRAYSTAPNQRPASAASTSSSSSASSTSTSSTAPSTVSAESSSTSTKRSVADTHIPTSEVIPSFQSEDADLDLSNLSPKALPADFGANQDMQIDDAMKSELRSLLATFRAPIRYAFAYGSGVFSQGSGTTNKKPMIDLIFGVTYTQHFHSLNLHQHPDHYSFMGKLGSAAITYVQDKIGAGVYFNPYVEVNGVMIKYGIVNINTLQTDLKSWDTLYLAGRLHKPVKILRDDPTIRLANQSNLISALRCALLLLPEQFTEFELYKTIAGISYLGDPRMRFRSENPHKVANIVSNQLDNFRRLYGPLIEQLPNLDFTRGTAAAGSAWSQIPQETQLTQDMSPLRRGNIVRRLPLSFREKLYFQYQKKFQIPRPDFQKMINLTPDQERTARKEGGLFEQRIAADDRETLAAEVRGVIGKTVMWPSTTQSLKGILTAGPGKSLKYLGKKRAKFNEAAGGDKKKE
ncbi:Mmp37-domain-containing protein [Ascobolus immersus RN42]|uniref:Phosphatidate cytidylyltransferase, mitochondrial n=1 Tax=Ascobolus immersus RN42 TaxID=1160509 RepID=A0A3N4I8J4_ASCIM|nr:Mmp37-domain-containing protein [Ascobolus immersus RN42]